MACASRILRKRSVAPMHIHKKGRHSVRRPFLCWRSQRDNAMFSLPAIVIIGFVKVTPNRVSTFIVN